MGYNRCPLRELCRSNSHMCSCDRQSMCNSKVAWHTQRTYPWNTGDSIHAIAQQTCSRANLEVKDALLAFQELQNIHYSLMSISCHACCANPNSQTVFGHLLMLCRLIDPCMHACTTLGKIHIWLMAECTLLPCLCQVNSTHISNPSGQTQHDRIRSCVSLGFQLGI